MEGSPDPHDLHVHDCLEVGVLLKDELIYKFGGHTYRGQPGDVFVCRPFEPHWSYALPGRTFESILVLFSPSLLRQLPDGGRLLLPFYTQMSIPPLIPAHTSYAQNIRDAAVRAAEAQARQSSSWMTRQYMHLIAILLEIEQFAAEFQAEKQTGNWNASVSDTVGFLLEHYQEALDTDMLVGKSGLGRTSFFAQFGALTGQTPHEFVNRLRLQHAMDLLRTSRLSMIEVAESSGFQSLSTFNKQFKQHIGVAPREYRRAYPVL
ncbi:AraC family transcriptional regulator [Paenibacillus sp. GCM10023248]|uniref:AraC family transcriptional regulator n=1 Tax=Bacillus sp. 3255 TaxID=2817904 RepID=UPI00286A1B29|nr:AraC family transcriptional regulator [Bacillus sp. 3255]MDD9267347.1 AraC family transcriptional regulator [Paenibacillus sp. MAHUQ-63]